MQLAEGSLDLYSGNDDQIVPILSLGGIGVISVFSNICPKQSHDIVAQYLAGNTAESCRLQLEALPLIHALFCEVNPIPVKGAMNILGMEVGPLRLPLTEIEPQHADLLRNVIADYEAKIGMKLGFAK
jgi:4-hydroxy-tetrahydrodipicolinate synthase